MVILEPMFSPLSSLLINKDIASVEGYRLLTYCIILKEKDKYLLFNSLTRELLLLDQSEYDDMIHFRDSEAVKYLISNRFLVPEEHDDEKLKNQILTFSRLLTHFPGLNHYIIFSTLECNARCFYCFEHGAKRHSMSEKTAADAAAFILKKSTAPIHIQWFGGEPLYNRAAIDVIADALTRGNLEFKSTMITNGYLFDAELIEHAKKDWHLHTVQITLDGTEPVYNRIKAYIYRDGTSPFQRVLENIGLLVQAGINVLIRLNMDYHNREDLFALVDLLKERFAQFSDRLSVYVWLLYDNRGAHKTIRSDAERHELTADLMRLEDYIRECGFGQKALPSKSVRLYACPADNPNSAVILPDGRLGKYDHYSDSELYGDIYSDDFDENTIRRWAEHRAPVELCATCPIAPECMHIKMCPDDGSFDCDECEQKRRIKKIEMQILNAYKKYCAEHADES